MPDTHRCFFVRFSSFLRVVACSLLSFVAPSCASKVEVCACDGQVDWISFLTKDVQLGRLWLLQMGNAADKSGISIQYCMSYWCCTDVSNVAAVDTCLLRCVLLLLLLCLCHIACFCARARFVYGSITKRCVLFSAVHLLAVATSCSR